MGFIYILGWLTLASKDSWQLKTSLPSPFYLWAQFQVGLLDWADKGKQQFPVTKKYWGDTHKQHTQLHSLEWSLSALKEQWAASLTNGHVVGEASMRLPPPRVTEKRLDGLLTPTAKGLLHLTGLILLSLTRFPTPWFVVALCSLALPHISFHNFRHCFYSIHTQFGFYF